jgi:hypothetical protein
VAASALQKINHTIEPINVQVWGCYSSVTATKMATFKVQLPDFCNSKTITLRAYVDDAPVGVHDIILGTRVCQQLGLIFDFKQRLVHCDELSMVMKERGTINKATLNAIDNDDGLPLFLQQATLCFTKGISENTYNKHEYHEMIRRCTHLSLEQQNTFLQLFANYKDLFSGKLGLIPGPPVRLCLKPNSKPYYAKAYNIPQAIFSIARKEIDDLKNLKVIKSNVYSQ